jgi:Group 4 capsule polysaccharide lipoprotein gfcB, YjbF
MRRVLGLVALAALSGCSSGGTNPIMEEILEQASVFAPGGEEPEPAQPARRLTRADIEASNTAAIWARLESDPTTTLMYAVAANGGYVTFMSPYQQAVITRGSLVTGTRGLGTDLMSAWSRGLDPVMQPTPPARWPARVERSYEFPSDGPIGQVETFDCRFERGNLTEMTILEVRHRGVEISEICTGPSGRFENLHFADASTGFVWRSLQWTGPAMELLDLQVLEPYTGD